MLSLEKQMLFLISATEAIDVKQLVEIYQARGVANQVVRNALTRLKRDGYVISPERSKYAITAYGLGFITAINKKSLLFDKNWDGEWLTIMFEVPETERKNRDSFRNGLLQLGFAALYKSVYINPWNYTKEVLSLAEQYNMTDFFTIIRGKFVYPEPTEIEVKRLYH